MRVCWFDLGNGKRKHDEEQVDVEDDIATDEGKHSANSILENISHLICVPSDLFYRTNALLFQGSPISQLPTARIFAYATHFDAHPMGLEWVDDATCILVFNSKAAALVAYRHLQKSAAEDPDDTGFVTAKPIPVAVWPPEERINKSLGAGEGLKGTMRMRWARNEDVKKKGAKNESEFYKKHGTDAGKELYSEREGGPWKRTKRDVEEEQIQQKAQLDDELDEFLAEDDVDEPLPSKMRSDYIASDGKTLLERTSTIRIQGPPVSLESRLVAPLPRREWNKRTRTGRIKRGPQKGRSGTTERPKKSQQELDDELDSFLNDKDL